MTTAASDSASTADPYTDPPDQCDLVMKGGIASGAVYPSVVLTLARRYRFRSIGGTSVGAIAAALTAAAELGRERGAFTELERVRDEILAPGFILERFQPTPETAPLMATALDVTEAMKDPRAGKGVIARARAVLTAARRHAGNATRRGALIGALVGFAIAAVVLGPLLAALLLGYFGGWGERGVALGVAAVFALAFVVLGYRVGGVAGRAMYLGRVALTDLPQSSFFGMCTGMRGRAVAPGRSVHDATQPALTEWICARMDRLAGMPEGRPLTFRDLAEKGKREGLGEKRGIELRMVTTNLSQGQPYVFPAADAGGDRIDEPFLFREEEMRRFFPGYVVDFMVDRAPHKEMRLPASFHYLPAGADMPVIVATRLSLSFPILLSALPLYTVRPEAWPPYRQAEREGRPAPFRVEDFNKNWFSDGGICTNFPIHFYDAWLPSRPTFGINLTSLAADAPVEAPAGARDGRAVQADDATVSAFDERGRRRVYLPRAGGDSARADWAAVDGLGAFGTAIFRSAQNYRDNMYARMASYRERIVQIRLAGDEGGINLAMDAEKVAQMVRWGGAAGALLAGREDGSFNFEHHFWVRLRLLMHELEEQLSTIEERLDEAAIAALLDRVHGGSGASGADGRPFPYARREDWCDEAGARLGSLRRFIHTWRSVRPEQGDYVFDPPSRSGPEPALRVVPKL